MRCFSMAADRYSSAEFSREYALLSLWSHDAPEVEIGAGRVAVESSKLYALYAEHRQDCLGRSETFFWGDLFNLLSLRADLKRESRYGGIVSRQSALAAEYSVVGQITVPFSEACLV
ncbi:MAG: hypothetical protein ACP5I3_11640 [Thermoproteus sp.]